MEKKFYKVYKITELKFWQNFWDYYKVHMLFIVMIAAVVAVGVKSCANRVDNDISATYFGEKAMVSEEKLKDYLAGQSEDIDGDGQVTVEISNYPFGEGEDTQTVATVLQKIDADLVAGDPFILMTDEVFINRFVNMQALYELDEVVQGRDIPEQYLKRDGQTNKVVAIDITDMPAGKIVGVIPGKRMYIGMKVLPYSQMDNEKYMALHNQVIKIIKNMISM